MSRSILEAARQFHDFVNPGQGVLENAARYLSLGIVQVEEEEGDFDRQIALVVENVEEPDLGCAKERTRVSGPELEGCLAGSAAKEENIGDPFSRRT